MNYIIFVIISMVICIFINRNIPSFLSAGFTIFIQMIYSGFMAYSALNFVDFPPSITNDFFAVRFFDSVVVVGAFLLIFAAPIILYSLFGI